jgi:hypothetical protein
MKSWFSKTFILLFLWLPHLLWAQSTAADMVIGVNGVNPLRANVADPNAIYFSIVFAWVKNLIPNLK